MHNKTIPTAIIATILLAGCAQPPHKHTSNWYPSASQEVVSHPDYHRNLRQCAELASNNAENPVANAAAGAALGAGLSALVSIAVGADVGPLLGVGALAGGLSGLGNSQVNNEQRYREVMVRCLRDRGHQVY